MSPRQSPMLTDHIALAIIARIASGLFMAMLSAFAKAAGNGGAGVGEIIFFRQAMALPVVLIWILCGPGLPALRSNRPWGHLVRAIIGLFSMVFMFYALSLIPLTEAITIFFITPLVATCLSAMLLGEKVGINRWIAICVGFSGVLVVMQPGGGAPDVSAWGITVAIIAAVSMALVTITIRQLSATETEAATVFRFTAVGTVVLACLYPFYYQPHEPFTWLMMAGVGVCGAGAQVAAAMSLRLAPVSLTAPFDYIQLFWAALIGWLIWADLPAWTTVVGGLLIAGSGLFTFYRERLHRQSIAERTTPTS